MQRYFITVEEIERERKKRKMERERLANEDFERRLGMLSNVYKAEFECTPAQYHANIDKLWIALGVEGPQKDDCFTMAANEIVRLRNRVKELEAYNAESIERRAMK